MNVELKTKQEKECIERLKLLKQHYGLMDQVILDYKDSKLVHYSEHINFIFSGILYWVTNEPEYAQRIQEIEEQYNIKVYHCILTHYEIGDILTMLYVGENEEYWEEEREQLINGYPIVYGCNIDDDFCSEFGSAHIVGVNGGLKVE